MSVESRSERLLAVFRLVEGLLADPCEDVASSIAYSREHLNRILQSVIGESVKSLSLRLRLERAAYRLRSREGSATDAGFEAGYADVEAFIKAFRLSYGLSPGRLRVREDADYRLPCPSDLHWAPEQRATLQMTSFSVLRRRAALKVAAKLFVGDYARIPAEWQRMAAILPSRLTEQCVFRPITLFHDDGMRTSHRDQMRAHLGFVIGDAPVPPSFEVVEAPGGVYLTSCMTRAAEDHRAYWQALNAEWVSKAPVSRDQPGFDEYSDLPTNWGKVNATISLAVMPQSFPSSERLTPRGA